MRPMRAALVTILTVVMTTARPLYRTSRCISPPPRTPCAPPSVRFAPPPSPPLLLSPLPPLPLPPLLLPLLPLPPLAALCRLLTLLRWTSLAHDRLVQDGRGLTRAWRPQVASFKATGGDNNDDDDDSDEEGGPGGVQCAQQ